MMRGVGQALLVAMLLVAPLAGAFPWEDITIPEPRAGDAGLYRPGYLEFDGERVTDGLEGASLAFELGPRTAIHDAYGIQRPVSQFRAYAVADGQAIQWPVTSWVHERGQAPLATDFTMGTGTGQGASAGGYGGFSFEMQTVEYSHRGHQAWGPDCLLLNVLQGRELSEGAELPLENICGTDIQEAAAEEDLTISLEVVEVQALENGGTSARLLLTAQAPEGRIEVDIWYRDDIPYPVEIAFRMILEGGIVARFESNGTQASTDDPSLFDKLALPLSAMAGADGHMGTHGDGDERLVMEAGIVLERFERGTGDVLPLGDGPSWPQTRQGVEMAPVDAWGPADGGQTFTFPLSQATEAIRQDPTLVEFQRWRQEHPDAQVVFARHSEYVEDTRRYQEWWLLMGAPDGTGWSLTSERTTEARAGGVPLTEVPAAVVTNSAQRSDQHPYEQLIAAVPDRIPTIASALEVWHQTAPEAENGTDPNEYTWSMAADDAPGASVDPRITAGWRDPDEGEPEQPWVPDWGTSTSHVTLSPTDGALQRLDRLRTSSSWSWLSGPPSDDVQWAAIAFQGSGDRPAGLDAPVVVSVASISVVALLALLLVKAGVGIPLYSRLTKGELLDNDTRRRVYEVLQEDPGLRLSEVARRAGCSTSTARYHLRRLQREDMVRAAGEPRMQRWFPSGDMGKRAMEREAVLAIGNSREVYRAIQANPGSSLGEVADAIGTSSPAAHKVVDRLIEAGLVAKERDGRRVALHPVPPEEDASAPR